MTEKEAKTKWCPFARIFPAGDYWQSTNGSDVAAVLSDELRPLTRCLASRCMAWRWTSCDQGYCGLAGGV